MVTNGLILYEEFTITLLVIVQVHKEHPVKAYKVLTQMDLVLVMMVRGIKVQKPMSDGVGKQILCQQSTQLEQFNLLLVLIKQQDLVFLNIQEMELQVQLWGMVWAQLQR